ncbi:MAG: hypothetical protein OEY59_13965 [Deltaproteobacteria bacterium]|nr:hypothetical protein [Deltaproteobacteria bacterium]
MSKEERIIPTYCPICQSLTLIYQKREPESVQVVDFINDQWHLHSCMLVKKSQLLADKTIKIQLEEPWDSERLPFKLEGHLSFSINRKHSKGVVLSIESDKDKSLWLTLYSLEETIISLKIPPQTNKICAGMLLDLTGIIRTGKQKFRAKQIRPISLERENLTHHFHSKSLLKINLSSLDQEQLETYCAHILSFLKKNHCFPYYIVPMPVDHQQEVVSYRRQISLDIDPKIFDKLRQTDLPDYIQISFEEENLPA